MLFYSTVWSNKANSLVGKKYLPLVASNALDSCTVKLYWFQLNLLPGALHVGLCVVSVVFVFPWHTHVVSVLFVFPWCTHVVSVLFVFSMMHTCYLSLASVSVTHTMWQKQHNCRKQLRSLLSMSRHYRLQTNVWEGNILHLSISHSVCRGEGVSVWSNSYLTAWSHLPSGLGSVSCPMFLPERSLSKGSSWQRSPPDRNRPLTETTWTDRDPLDKDLLDRDPLDRHPIWKETVKSRHYTSC